MFSTDSHCNGSFYIDNREKEQQSQNYTVHNDFITIRVMIFRSKIPRFSFTIARGLSVKLVHFELLYEYSLEQCIKELLINEYCVA